MNFSSSFGGVARSGNSNLDATGTNNTGTLRFNSNLTIAAKNCDLEVESNSNADIDAENCQKLVLTQSSNNELKVKGSTNEVEARKNSNLELIGKNCTVNAVSNSNLDLDANDSLVIASHTSNTDIKAKDCTVEAHHCSNTTIIGNGGTISVTGIKNHVIQQKKPASNDELHTDVKLAKAKSSSGSIVFSGICYYGDLNAGSHSQFSNTNTTSTETFLTYIDSLEVDNSNYKTDNFCFTMEQPNLNTTEINVQITESNLEPGSLEIQQVGQNECHVSGMKNGGVKHVIRFKAGVIKEIDESQKSFTLEVR